MAKLRRYWKLTLEALFMATVAATLFGLEIASADDGSGM